jgi:hypothetical protein
VPLTADGNAATARRIELAIENAAGPSASGKAGNAINR